LSPWDPALLWLFVALLGALDHQGLVFLGEGGVRATPCSRRARIHRALRESAGRRLDHAPTGRRQRSDRIEQFQRRALPDTRVISDNQFCRTCCLTVEGSREDIPPYGAESRQPDDNGIGIRRAAWYEVMRSRGAFTRLRGAVAAKPSTCRISHDTDAFR
jgi:hypothetical protein